MAEIQEFKRNLADIGLFRLYLQDRNLSEGVIIKYLGTIQSFYLRQPELGNINDYNEFLRDNIKTNHHYIAIKHFLKYKMKKDPGLRNMLTNNLLKPRPSDPVYSSAYLPIEKRTEVIARINSQKHKIMAKIQCQTGARAGDVLKILRGNITFESFDNKIAMVIVFIGKRKKRVVKYIYDRLLQDEIKDFISNNFLSEKFYFTEFNKSKSITSEYNVLRVNYKWYLNDLKGALVASNVDPRLWATHDFRRAIARDIWEHPTMGKDLVLLQNFLGHSNVNTTVRYLRNSGLANKEASQKIASEYGLVVDDLRD